MNDTDLDRIAESIEGLTAEQRRLTSLIGKVGDTARLRFEAAGSTLERSRAESDANARRESRRNIVELISIYTLFALVIMLLADLKARRLGELGASALRSPSADSRLLETAP
jgi:hypothetical protein